MPIKDAKRNFIINEAVSLFLQKSVCEVTIKDIAKAAGVGEATVYRYFSGRRQLVLACALKLQDEVGQRFLNVDESKSGYMRLCTFYKAFVDVFTQSPELYRFLSEFDAYCISEGVTELEQYADNMDSFKAVFLKAYRDGLHDGSVRCLDNMEVFYYSTTHAVLSLCKKLAAQGDVIRQDRAADKKAEPEALTDIILAYLKK